MKKLFLGLVVSLSLVVAAPIAAGASHNNGQGPSVDHASGTGKIEQFGTFVHATATADPGGTGANGSFFVRQTFFRLPLDFSGRVTCLLVIGNKAIIGGEVTKNRPVEPGGVLPNPAPGSGVLIDMRDNDANGTPDTLNFTFRPVPPTECPALNSHQFPLDQGSVTVHDA